LLQDRLVKALRLAKINDLENANRFLEEPIYGSSTGGLRARRPARWTRTKTGPGTWTKS